MSKEKVKAHEKDYWNIIVNEFKTSLRERRRSESTIDNYCRVTGSFIKFANINTKEEMETLTKSVVRNYVDYLVNDACEDGKKYSVETVNNKIAGMNQLFAFCGLKDLKEKALYCHRKTHEKTCWLTWS